MITITLNEPLYNSRVRHRIPGRNREEILDSLRDSYARIRVRGVNFNTVDEQKSIMVFYVYCDCSGITDQFVLDLDDETTETSS